MYEALAIQRKMRRTDGKEEEMAEPDCAGKGGFLVRRPVFVRESGNFNIYAK